jgi:hypothetical protein
VIKVFQFLQRRPDVDWYAFRSYVGDEFVNAALTGTAGELVDRIVTNYVLEHDFRPTTNAQGHRWDAVVELYVADERRALEFLAADRTALDESDRAAWIAVASSMVVDEQLVYDRGPVPGAAKIFGIFKNSLPVGAPLSREQTLREWKGHGRRMDAKRLPDLIEKFTRNIALSEVHADDPRYDYDGASIVWCNTIEIAEQLYKDYDIEQAVIPSSEAMGSTAGDCVYLRTDEVERFRRS